MYGVKRLEEVRDDNKKSCVDLESERRRTIVEGEIEDSYDGRTEGGEPIRDLKNVRDPIC